jgi:hypothetical protein
MADIVTKEMLKKQVDEQAAMIEELKSQLAARDALLTVTGEDGWLITTPNPRYNGVTYNIEFRNGRAFVPDRSPEDKLIVQQLVHGFNYVAQRMTGKEYKEMAQPAKAAAEPKGVEALVPTAMRGAP